MKTDEKENPQTVDLERLVRAAGMWKEYQTFTAMMTDTARIKYAHTSEEQREAFVKTCKYAFCAGVTEAARKWGDQNGNG